MQSGDEPVASRFAAPAGRRADQSATNGIIAWSAIPLPIVDTWWQTETGGILITPPPGAIAQKPGSATKPFFGVVPEIVDADGKVSTRSAGNLCIAKSWPGQMRRCMAIMHVRADLLLD